MWVRVPPAPQFNYAIHKNGPEPLAGFEVPVCAGADGHAHVVILAVMSETMPLAKVRAHLSEVVDRVTASHERVNITRHGRREAVVIAADEADRLRAEINQADPGRIRLAVVTNATLSQGGGERALANAIASCAADGDGVTLVTTDKATYLVTSYADYRGTSQAVEAALNTHPGMAAGLRDAVNRMASIDPGS